MYATCAMGVVYDIPFSCGALYVGQTGRCFNDHLQEHKMSLGATPSGHLAIHKEDCGCRLLFSQTSVLFRSKDQKARELKEICHQMNRLSPCFSNTPISLFEGKLSTSLGLHETCELYSRLFPSSFSISLPFSFFSFVD